MAFHLKALYCPILQPGSYYERARANKHGLRDALAQYGETRQIDYLAIGANERETVLRTEIDALEPDLLFMQIQGTDAITTEMLKRLRDSYPALKICNWNGDVWDEHLISPDMLDLMQQVDLQLVVNASVLPVYAKESIAAAFCPFGYEEPLHPLPEVPEYDVVFLGNAYSAERHTLYHALRALPCRVGIYGAGWERADGECNYDFATAEALYRRATIAISDNQFPDAKGYLSDRPIQVLAAGGAILFQQTVKDLRDLTGLTAGVHYVGYDTLETMTNLIQTWLEPERALLRTAMAARGQGFVLQAHTWGARVRQLVTEWLPELEGIRV